MEGTPELIENHLVDISAAGFALQTSHDMALPWSHSMQGRTYYANPIFHHKDYDERSLSPLGIHEQVKRPLNAFMLYRKDKQAEILTGNPKRVSRIIGTMWNSESPDTKAKYHALAQNEREKHRLAHPGYIYSPNKPIKKKVPRIISPCQTTRRGGGNSKATQQ